MKSKSQSIKNTVKQNIKKLLPLAGVIIALLVQVLVPDNSSHPAPKAHYYTIFLLALSVIPLIVFVLSFFFYKRQKVPPKTKLEWLEIFEDTKKELQEMQTQITATDKEINTLVYKLYDLTDEEI